MSRKHIPAKAGELLTARSAPAADDAESRIYLNLGRLIAEERKKLGLTVRGLEKLSGVGSGFIGDIENGRGNPTWKTLCALSDGLKRNLIGLLAEAYAEYLTEGHQKSI